MLLVDRLLSRATWPIVAIVVSLGMLGIAHAFERFAYMAPCQLCLRQREVYWAIAGMALAGVLLARVKPTPRFPMALNVLIGLGFLVGGMVALYHAGVEWRWWPAPEGCVGGGPVDVLAADLGLEGRQATVSCLDSPWHFLGLSMAGWNFAISIVLAIISFRAAAGGATGTVRSPIPG